MTHFNYQNYIEVDEEFCNIKKEYSQFIRSINQPRKRTVYNSKVCENLEKILINLKKTNIRYGNGKIKFI